MDPELSIVPDSKPGQRERTREQYGIVACLWNHPGRRFGVQVTHDRPGTVEYGLRRSAEPGAGNAVRYEMIKSLGDQAMAI